MSKSTQKGMGVIGLLFTLGMIAIVALLVMKVVPVYIEYFTVKKAIAASVSSGTSPAAVRSAFNKQADIDSIDVIRSSDLQISGNTVSFAYDKQIHLFGNVSLLIEFEGTSTASGGR
jgi:hypothetical protein